MRLKNLHRWDVNVKEAMELQLRLASAVSCTSSLSEDVQYVAGLDISAPRHSGIATGAAVVLRYPSMEVEEVCVAEHRATFPYVPGLLSFREVPVLVGALETLSTIPDLVFVDGQGYAHPRRFGLACHLGLMLDLPTVGCAKSILVGTHAPLSEEEGAWVGLVDNGEVIGAALRTRAGASPVYVSVGHRIDLESAIMWTLACCCNFRLPEPARLAHQAAGGHLASREPAHVNSSRVIPTQEKLF